MGLFEKIKEAAENTGTKKETAPEPDSLSKKGNSCPDTVKTPENSGKKALRKKLREQIEETKIERESTGMKGGLSTDSSLKETNKVEVANKIELIPEDPTSLLNKGSDPGTLEQDSVLKGGLENKVATEDVNSGKVKDIVTDFKVSGGIGADVIGEDITQVVHVKDHTPIRTDKQIKVETNAGAPPAKSENTASPAAREENLTKQDRRQEDSAPQHESANTRGPNEESKKDSEKNEIATEEETENGGKKTTRESVEKQITEDLSNLSEEEAEKAQANAEAGQSQISSEKGAEKVSGATLGVLTGLGIVKQPEGNKENESSGEANRGRDSPDGSKREFEEKPETSPSSPLSRERDSGRVLYETTAYKKRYFLQWMWVKRHFTISNNGVMKYYKDVNSRRRGEHNISESFSSYKAYEESGNHKYRISLIGAKKDDLGFDSAEKRDEFLYWFKKSMQ